MLPRRALIACALAAALALAGCGWEPLYADRQTGPTDAALRSIRVQPIPERIGQKLELALRRSLNPRGESTPQRYILSTILQVSRADLGVLTQGLGTRGRLDVYANYTLTEIRSGAKPFNSLSHVEESFDILANEYSNVVAEDDARDRAVEELRRDMIDHLTVFMQRRAAETGSKP